MLRYQCRYSFLQHTSGPSEGIDGVQDDGSIVYEEFEEASVVCVVQMSMEKLNGECVSP